MKNILENKKKAFIKCVKDNYDSIIGLLMLDNQSDDSAFRYFVLNLKNSFSEMMEVGEINFQDVQHADFFNQLIKKSELLSNCAALYLEDKVDYSTFMNECKEYIKDSSEWVVLYSLYLK